MDTETKRAISGLTRLIRDQQRTINQLVRGQRTPQIGRSSIDTGALEVRDADGATRMRIGWQPDGSVALVTEGGEAPPAPSAPVLTPSIGGLRVAWDGRLVDGAGADAVIPADFDHINVHVSTTPGFTPAPGTFAGTIRRGGGTLPVVRLPYTEHHVVLVPVTTGGVTGTPSAPASATPLQVEGPDLVAGSVTTAHLAAGSVTADKLEALLVLATTILAGIPGGARVELDAGGLRGYNASDELIFAIDSAGNAVFSGDITGSTISGSSMQVGQAPGATGVTEASGDAVYSMVTAANNSRAQIRAAELQAEFSAFSDSGDPNAPAAGFIAAPSHVSFVLNSDNAGGNIPAVAGRADPTQAFLAVRSAVADLTAPRCDTVATADEVITVYQAGSGAGMRLRADGTYSVVEMTTPPSTLGNPAADYGSLFALRRTGTDVPAWFLQSPASVSGAGAGLRSGLFMEGATDGRAYTRMVGYARDYDLNGQILADGSADTATLGRVRLADNLSVNAPRHQYTRTELVSQPTAASPSNGAWNDFTGPQFPALTFTTGDSGRVRIVLAFCAINKYTDTSSLALGFRLSGGSTMAASLTRCALIRSTGTGTGSSIQTTAVVYLGVAANADYTLTPQWRTSGSAVSSPAQTWTSTGGDLWIDTALDNAITVEPLM
ncbi:hypothetical protein [Allonocardiopsis opalescens]|uniref:Uncharacterized protein n=1 Tax=Allonocardiopsis opalescens TaxID=1144618 RepID=A0A2T0PVK1_9ACTN|nr:hypothetical protein [Allonocardiopsis opalescens]PRX95563.1 hypothetical protein CLV72_109172 [Allonocardiopsis opalescens]